jgi:lipopolysaccharide transport system permease protein
MNPHASHPASLQAMARSLWHNRRLIAQMTRREVVGRYQGSILGLAWSFFNPLLMLTAYTFVFSVVFKARWGQGDGESRAQFAVILFVGMIVHGLFAEVINRAPSLIVGNANYVKKVVFPLEILPAVSLGAALFHAVASLVVLLAAVAILTGPPNWTAALIPLVLLPLAIFSLGLAWLLAALGVFLRDVGHAVGIVTSLMLFLSPVFFPVSALPEAYRPLLLANPLTFIIEQARMVLIFKTPPDWAGMCLYSLAALAVAWLGYASFQKTRKGFADVL